ncbi:TonB-dependent receptor [Parasphingorhabdus cellanae]|uniref:TonB-dependent receptor n=1 Tax=Parasphingorhabdus cellanae TaxID=2806553 RepID=A0ABX7T3A6_9SPHN|nr:TonB-dependent receptor [Parasphingorhabdus cellanae]QTD55631.1 TonB-dependent receptor [Parasphingorhabdus cellanae]
MLKRSRSKTSLPALALSLAFAANSVSAVAQDNLDAADGGAADDNVIIVTAQKIEQRSTDVPITISAATGERLRELGVSDLDELSNYIPGLNIQEQSANNPGIVIRGITSDSGSSQQAPRVTLYYNGVDISRSRGSYQDAYDIERIEVIKGPQATLFGTASAVGAISIVSNKPEAGFSGELSGSYGNFDAYTVAGHLNAGSDIIAGRVAFAYKRRDGYVENLAPNQDDLYAQNQLGIRGSLRYTPSDDFTADLIFTYDRQRNSGTPFISGSLPTTAGPANPFGPAFLGGSPFFPEVLGDDELGLIRDVYDANFTFSWDFDDDWTLTMVNGYRNFDSNEIFDADGSAAVYLEFAEEAQGDQWSHETRFSYNNGSTFRGSFGWNIFREDSNQRVPLATDEVSFLQCFQGQVVVGVPCVSADGIPAGPAIEALTGGTVTAIPYTLEFENLGKNDSYSVFADGTWIPIPELELTAGIRAIIEKRRSGYRAFAPNSVLAGIPLFPVTDTAGQTFRTEDSFQAFLPRFNILYRFSDDINGFATISKGRRSPTVDLDATGSANGPIADFTAIPEETVWNYEVGLKGSFGPVSGSLGVYYQTYEGFQVSVVNPETGLAETQSAGSAKNFGVEAEVGIQAADWLNIFANIGYIDGGIDNSDDIADNFRDARFRLQPEVQAAGGFTIDYPINDNTRFFMTPSITYRSKIFFQIPNDPAISEDAVTLVNLRAGMSFANDQFELAGFARNLTNENYLLDAGNTGGAFGIPTFIPAEPRFYGVELTARF